MNKEELESGTWYIINNNFPAWWDGCNEMFEESSEGDGDAWAYEEVDSIELINE